MMTKKDYVEEILSEKLAHYGMSKELLRYCAEDVVDGLDVWYELSGDAVASSNRYGYLEREKEEAVKQGKKELEQLQKKHEEEKAEIDRNVRWMRQRMQNQIEELQKQVKG